MQRVGFRLQLNTDTLDEYVRRHAEVWPDMLEALRSTGWTNYSLFLDREDGALFGYFETPDLDAARAGMAKLDVNTRWQAEMAPFFQQLAGKKPDEGFTQLESVFYLA
ncbi:MAG: L-rhamnose mutarotase [Pontimonas sp.]|nr:L-rhamnose mutarotase [Pontimonas sp.]